MNADPYPISIAIIHCFIQSRNLIYTCAIALNLHSIAIWPQLTQTFDPFNNVSVEQGFAAQDHWFLNMYFFCPLAQIVSVQDFGAVGDGITNDTVAVQNAWNSIAANGGGVLYFPTGR